MNLESAENETAALTLSYTGKFERCNAAINIVSAQINWQRRTRQFAHLHHEVPKTGVGAASRYAVHGQYPQSPLRPNTHIPHTDRMD